MILNLPDKNLILVKTF